MTRTRPSVEIERPAPEVFAFVADMANNPQWQKGMRSCVWTSDPPIGVGSTYDQEASFLGRTIESSFTVTEFEPGRCIRIQSTRSTFPLDITRAVEPTGDRRCRVSADVRGEPGGVFRLLGPLPDRMVARSVAADYRRLKELLETS